LIHALNGFLQTRNGYYSPHDVYECPPPFTNQISGVDSSPTMIGMAYDNNRGSIWHGSVYELGRVWQLPREIDIIVCRNVLHRLENPELALQNMYTYLSDNGKLYIRDVRRDAPWTMLVKRIGKERQGRWLFPELVKDYVGAMANAFTKTEFSALVANTLMNKNGINYTITDGEHLRWPTPSHPSTHQLNWTAEYAQETEFVCVIEKKNG